MSPIVSHYRQIQYPEQRNPMTQDQDPRLIDVDRIEAAAAVIYGGGTQGDSGAGWGRLSPELQNSYRKMATAALQAADKAADAAKPDPRVEVLAKALFKSMYSKMKWKRTTIRRQQMYRRIAADGLAALDKAAKA